MSLAIFVGPKKTGTSWLHHVVSGSTRAKEIRYPSRWGRSFVYRRFVEGRSVLIWPYLLHERDALQALLNDLEARGESVRVIVATRGDAEWINSMRKFLEKYGSSPGEALEEARREREVVEENLAWLRGRIATETVQIIDPGESDLMLMSDACSISVETLRAATGERIYESSESSRIPSRHLVNLFFRIKPFLPLELQEITKARRLRRIFFQPRQRDGQGSDKGK